MISEQEAREAAERYAEWRHGKRSSPYDSPYFNCDGDDPAMISKDRAVLADAYIAELARREAERAERAKPIDAEWLELIGFSGAGMNGWSMLFDCKCGSVIELFLNHDNEVSLAQDSDIVALTSLEAITTRGQLLDLLVALKGGDT